MQNNSPNRNNHNTGRYAEDASVASDSPTNNTRENSIFSDPDTNTSDATEYGNSNNILAPWRTLPQPGAQPWPLSRQGAFVNDPDPSGGDAIHPSWRANEAARVEDRAQYLAQVRAEERARQARQAPHQAQPQPQAQAQTDLANQESRREPGVQDSDALHHNEHDNNTISDLNEASQRYDTSSCCFAIPVENPSLYIVFYFLYFAITIYVTYLRYKYYRSVLDTNLCLLMLYPAICIYTQTIFIPLIYSGPYTPESYMIHFKQKIVKSNMLYMFAVKAKKSDPPQQRGPPEALEKSKKKDIYYVHKAKHNPPANKEWLNSIYAYNGSSVKVLPSLDKTVLSFVKSYFSLYSRRLERRVKIQHRRARSRRLSTIRMLVSKAEVKHTADKAVVTIYVYNRFKKHYHDIINGMWPLDHVDKNLYMYLKNEVSEQNERLNAKQIKTGKAQKMLNLQMPVPLPSKTTLTNVKKGAIELMSKVSEHRNRYMWLSDARSIALLGNYYRDFNVKNHERKYLKHYVVKCLRKEITSAYYRQLMLFHKSKFEKGYLRPFTKLVEGVYNKRVEFNLVNLKYLYHNSYIFSSALVTKLRNRNNKILTVLRTSLEMFMLPQWDGLAVYNEIYKRKKLIQNLTVNDFIKDKHSDKWENSLLKLDCKNFFSFLTNDVSNNYTHLTNNVFGFLKNKSIGGARFQVSGRLTKRNTAERAISKLSYKGNIKNTDSSDKGLSTVMLRGHAKSNLEYNQFESRVRIGSFGLKSWVSSN